MLSDGFISYESLLSYGVPEYNVKNMCSKYRKGNTLHWENVRVNNRVYIKLDSIPAFTRKKYNIPTSEEYEATRIQEEENSKNWHLDTNYQKIKASVNSYGKYFNHYVEALTNLGYSKSGVLEKARKFSYRHAFWVGVLEVAPTFRHPLSRVCHEIGVELTKEIPILKIKDSFYHFCKTLNIARREGVDKIVSKYLEKDYKYKHSRTKFGEYEKALAYYYFTRPERYTQSQVLRIVNHILEQEKRLQVSLSWLKTLRVSTEFKTFVEMQSRGKKYSKDCQQPYLHRINHYANRVWQMDGTPSQTMCWENGQWIRPYLFKVIDVFSKKIIGFSVSKTEDRHAVMAALQMAVEYTGQVANEIVVDNAGAFKTDELQEIKLQMEKLGVYWRFTTPENAQDKSQIERFWATFQGRYENILLNYIGRGITTDNSKRPSTAFINKNLKNTKFSLNDLKNHLALITGIYNAEKVKDISPNMLYNMAENPNKIEVNDLARVMLFAHTTNIKVSRSEIKLTYKKKHYFYSVPNEVAMYYNGRQVKVKYEPLELDKIWIFDECDTLLAECKEINAVPMASIDRSEADNLAIAKVDTKKKNLIKMMNAKHEEYLKPLVGKDLPHILHTYKNEINDTETSYFTMLVGKYNEVDRTTIKPINEINSRTEFERSDYDKMTDLLSGRLQSQTP